SGLKDHLTGEPLPDNTFAHAPQLPDLRFTPAPLGVRTRKTDSKGTTQYLVDNTGNVAAELDQNNAVRIRYLHTPNIDDPLSITDQYGNTHFMLQDGPGSVAMLTDQRGDPFQVYTYEPFGKPNATTHESNSLKYTGKPFDHNSGLQYNNARYYDPATGRWIIQDPLVQSIQRTIGARINPFEPQTLHAYLYVNNRPLSFNDPTGLLRLTQSCLQPKTRDKFQAALNVLYTLANTDQGCVAFFKERTNANLSTILRSDGDPKVFVEPLVDAWGAFRQITPDRIFIDPRTIDLPKPTDLASTLLHECAHYAYKKFNPSRPAFIPPVKVYQSGAGPLSMSLLAYEEGEEIALKCFGEKAIKPLRRAE
ncbi:MAG: RHS repeat-associated core domain-containing protein, partial [Chloroflexota bacterium]